MISIDQVETRDELADLLHIRHNLLTYVLYIAKPDSYYQTFYIPKKNGESREIQAPRRELKRIQKRLALELSVYQQSMYKTFDINTNIAHAFRKGRSIITNAKIHKNKRYIVNIDLKDFFHSIHFGRVKGFFEKNTFYQLPSTIATIIAQLTCYNGRLPQGAPSSPVITNLICQVLDYHVLRIAKKYRLDYTRYADDMTFSTNMTEFWNERETFLSDLTREIDRNGFRINDAKTRFIKRESKQTVTGLTVNKKINADRIYYKETRAMADRLYKTGSFNINGKPGTISMLEGRFSFIDQITKFNNKKDGKTHDIRTLCARERDYQKFLFYKYFYANERPLIITEGKTDIIYIKSALKKLYDVYPQLIKKNSDGSFCYKISFFHRTPRMKYFFNISMDGADTITKIHLFYSGNNKMPNYYQELSTNQKMKNAIIFLFDNETKSDRPLKKFIGYCKLDDAQKEELQEQCFTRLIDGSELYLATVPLVEGDDESEIEDLFPKAVKDIRIEGKMFYRKNDFNPKIHYGKEVFSKYIYNNYDAIDFSGFIPLLDAIVKAIKTK